MPMIDMPLKDLHHYQGASSKPKDFDAYWDSALEELACVNADVSMTPASFQVDYAECYDLYFTGTRGARVYAKVIKPKNISQPIPALLKFHGYTGSSGDWFHLLPYAASGMIVAAMDCRGQGGKSQDIGDVKGGTLYGFIIKGLESGKDHLYFRHVFLDTARLASIIFDMPEVDSKRVYSSGGSQGGALSLACSALEPRISKTVAVYPFLSDYRRVWEMDLVQDAYDGLKQYFRHFDPLHQKEEMFFDTLSYIDVQFLSERIHSRVLMVTGLMDQTCPASTQFAAYNKITSDKSMDIYPDFGHEYLPEQADRELAFLLQTP